MRDEGTRASGRHVVTVEGLQALIDCLRGRGFSVVGPTAAEGAILFEEIDSVEELPLGLTDAQDAGRYELRRRDDDALFGYAVGPHSWKKFLHQPLLRLWRAERRDGGVVVAAQEPDAKSYALLGVRACDLRAIAIQDRVLLGGDYIDPHYQARRERAFIVAVNCGEAGGTCFCASMGAGPKARAGYDLALTELLSPDGHFFLIEAGSPQGEATLAQLPRRPATEAEIAQAEELVARTAENMGRRMPQTDVHALLSRNFQHPRWEDAAQRCLSCANCTMVCPTCFCTSVEDHNDLAGVESSRTRRWDSCFTMDYSYIHGGAVRPGVASRYRQWMTHKLATWHEQFGSSGCVGCGRCITWCPVGIDITEETRAIAESEQASGASLGKS